MTNQYLFVCLRLAAKLIAFSRLFALVFLFGSQSEYSSAIFFLSTGLAFASPVGDYISINIVKPSDTSPLGQIALSEVIAKLPILMTALALFASVQAFSVINSAIAPEHNSSVAHICIIYAIFVSFLTALRLPLTTAYFCRHSLTEFSFVQIVSGLAGLAIVFIFKTSAIYALFFSLIAQELLLLSWVVVRIDMKISCVLGELSPIKYALPLRNVSKSAKGILPLLTSFLFAFFTLLEYTAANTISQTMVIAVAYRNIIATNLDYLGGFQEKAIFCQKNNDKNLYRKLVKSKRICHVAAFVLLLSVWWFCISFQPSFGHVSTDLLQKTLFLTAITSFSSIFTIEEATYNRALVFSGKQPHALLAMAASLAVPLCFWLLNVRLSLIGPLFGIGMLYYLQSYIRVFLMKIFMRKGLVFSVP